MTSKGVFNRFSVDVGMQHLLISAEKIEKRRFFSYDNMCHLDDLKVAMKPLPLQGHFEHLWMDITKIIDSLHIANHKDRLCREAYNPEQLNKEHP